MRLQRVIVLVTAAVCLAGAAVYAQQKFTSATSLLTFDVSVLDRDGNPVTDLRPDDFVVTVNKETQPVRTMVFLATNTRTTVEPGRAPSNGTASATAVAAATSSGLDPKLLVIMIDDMSIYPTDSKGLFVAAERFIDTIPARDWVGLTSTSGRVTVNPSLDRAPLMTDLKHAFGWMNDPRRDTKPFVGFMDALEADGSGASLQRLIETTCGLPPSKNLGQLLAESECASATDRKVRDNATFARVATRNQLDSYIAVIKAMASAPGVKQLVVLTGGIALKPADSLDFIPVAKAAAAAGVQITMLMEEPGDEVAPPGFVKDQRLMLQQAETLAEMSGGQLFHVIGQADRFYQRVLTSASAIYRLGVDLPTTVPPDGNYQLVVTVKRPGVRVLASRYTAPPADAPSVEGVKPAAPAVPTPSPAPPASPTAPVGEVATLLAKAGAYLDSYEKAFSVVVAEETYTQELEIAAPITTRPVARDRTVRKERTLRADVLQTSIGQREWVAFRDVYDVDGQSVRDRNARLQKLFVDSPAQAVEQARRIVAESARFNLGALRRDFNVPTMALTYLRASNQSRSTFTVAGRKSVDPVPAVVLEFKERATPTIIRSADGDLPATGRFWIEPESGRVLKSEISIADRRAAAKITVTYGALPKLTVWAPILMVEEYTGPETIRAEATYKNFRQFSVSVEIK